MPNPFVHVELSTDSPDKAKKFYSALFAWEFEDASSPIPGGVYTHIKVGEGTGGGLRTKPAPEAPTMWLPYVLVDSVEATLNKAGQLGAKVVVEKTAVPDMGAFAILVDPRGASFGIWEVIKK
jgi:predicted enzyme related to lactoylglutathione lyase